jgi:hypothetical protein
MGKVLEAGSWTVVPPVCETGDVEILVETSAHRLRPQATGHRPQNHRPETTDQARNGSSKEDQGREDGKATGFLSLSLCRPWPIRAALYFRVQPKADNLSLHLEEQQKEWARRTGSSLKKCNISPQLQ